ncbi:cutinase family protein [Nocardia transvalensis]|nr:cutinase family protein [Nocardia transvalensis]
MSRAGVAGLLAVACRGVAVLLTVAVVASPAVAGGEPAEVSVPLQGCPGLYVLAVQGTGQSAPNAPVSADTGMLASVLEPVTAAARGLVARAYVPYDAAFGGAVPGGPVPYSVSVVGGLAQLRGMASAVVAQCPTTELGLVGYSQGAHIVSMFAQEVGQGRGAIPADRVAGVALLADPTRRPGAPLFPGAPGRTLPAPAPGTAGTEVGRLRPFPQPALTGGGIGPDQDIAADFGALTGRVASLCMPGDLACDAPSDLPMLRTIVNIVGQADLDPSDPIAALTSITHAIEDTVARTAVEIADRDLVGHTLGTLSLAPKKTLSQRLAEASDPRMQTGEGAQRALLKLATSALNTVIAITGVVLTQGEVAEIGAAAATDPLAGLHRLGEAIVTAAGRPVPRAKAFHLITQMFDAVAQLMDDTAELIDPAIWTRYLDTASRHGAYVAAARATGGRPAVLFVADWFTALARDLAGPRLPAGPSAERPAESPNVPLAQPIPLTEEPSTATGSGAVDESGTPKGSIRSTPHVEPRWRLLGLDRETERYYLWLLGFVALAILSHRTARVLAPRDRFLIGANARRERDTACGSADSVILRPDAPAVAPNAEGATGPGERVGAVLVDEIAGAAAHRPDPGAEQAASAGHPLLLGGRTGGVAGDAAGPHMGDGPGDQGTGRLDREELGSVR